MLNLDTHILLHALNGSITPTERKLLESDTWSISAIVLWEIAKLAQLGRIRVDMDDRDFLLALDQVNVWPITMDICREIRSLDFVGDPADELIAATSVVHDIPLVTRDRAIRQSQRVRTAK